MASTSKEAEDSEPLCVAGGNVNGADAVGNGMAVPQKVNTNLSHPAIPLAGVLPEELKAGSQVVAYSCP